MQPRKGRDPIILEWDYWQASECEISADLCVLSYVSGLKKVREGSLQLNHSQQAYKVLRTVVPDDC